MTRFPRIPQRHESALTGRPKLPYATWGEAEAAARELMGGEGKGHLLTAYRCPTCHWWHIGREPMKRLFRR